MQLSTASPASPTTVSSPPSATPVAIAAPQYVARIEGSLPSLSLPAQMIPGAYIIDCVVSSSDGKVLQKSNFVVFVGTGMPALSTVLAYPPSTEPGSSFLLAAVVVKAGGPAGCDPWIKWSRGGTVFAQGLLSAGLDRVVWTAPLAEGAYALSVDVYPCAPPDASGFAFASSAHQDIKAMVRMPAGGSTDEFSAPLRFYSLLRFSGNFDDTGTRLRASQPSELGSPRMDVYSGGFGYRFGATAGLRIPGLLPPSNGGAILPLALLFRVAPDGRDGRLIHFASEDDSFAMDLGLQNGHPYVETFVNGQGWRSVAYSAVPEGPLTLAAALSPENGRLEIVWIADGERLFAPSLPLVSVPQKGGATIGGSLSLAGVYGAFGLISGSSLPPLYRLEEMRRWRGDLVWAEGFENDELPEGSTTYGSVSFSSHGLALGPMAGVKFGRQIRVDRRLLVDVQCLAAPSAALLDILGSEGERLASLSASGELLDGKEVRLGYFRFSSGRLRFTISLDGGSLVFASEDGSLSHRLPGPADSKISLGLRNDSKVGSVQLAHILVRSAGASPSQ
jgi:hypothetical protein